MLQACLKNKRTGCASEGWSVLMFLPMYTEVSKLVIMGERVKYVAHTVQLGLCVLWKSHSALCNESCKCFFTKYIKIVSWFRREATAKAIIHNTTVQLMLGGAGTLRGETIWQHKPKDCFPFNTNRGSQWHVGTLTIALLLWVQCVFN